MNQIIGVEHVSFLLVFLKAFFFFFAVCITDFTHLFGFLQDSRRKKIYQMTF